jgi:FKBP-type peptidyl-prolyl cis-trans isomerase
MTVELIADQAAYDQQVIKNYMAANNLSGYNEVTSGPYTGMWYKITTAPTGTTTINENSTITLNYSLYLMNNTNPDGNTYASTNTYTITDISTNVDGFIGGLYLLGKGGGAISFIVPSKLAYGTSGTSGIAANSCLRWDVSNVTVTNP